MVCFNRRACINLAAWFSSLPCPLLPTLGPEENIGLTGGFARDPPKEALALARALGLVTPSSAAKSACNAQDIANQHSTNRKSSAASSPSLEVPSPPLRATLRSLRHPGPASVLVGWVARGQHVLATTRWHFRKTSCEARAQFVWSRLQ